MRKSQLPRQQINTRLMPPQHIQSKQQIHILTLHNRERAIELCIADLDLGLVHAAEDTSCAYAAGYAAEALVD